MSDQPAAKKPRRGRPPRGEDIHHIFLRESTFKLWNERKEAMGWKERTHNEFAELLLHQAPSRMLELATGRNVDCRRPLFESTPNPEAKQRGIALPLDISVDADGTGFVVLAWFRNTPTCTCTRTTPASILAITPSPFP